MERFAPKPIDLTEAKRREKRLGSGIAKQRKKEPFAHLKPYSTLFLRP